MARQKNAGMTGFLVFRLLRQSQQLMRPIATDLQTLNFKL